MEAKYPLFAKHDLDGFFGLFVDNVVQLLLIVALCSGLCGMNGEHAYLVYREILPAAALSILFGNLFYAWQAHRLARREGRDDVTALPYGINTPSLIIYVYFVIFPVYRATGNPRLAWQMGLVACLGSGLIELLGALIAEWIRKHTPRAALLSSLAGIAIGFIAMAFALQIWQQPLIAILPLGIILLTYFAKIRFPLGLPGGFVAVLLGTALAWLLPIEWTGYKTSLPAAAEAWAARELYLPSWAGGELIQILRVGEGNLHWLGYLSVIIPMGLFNVIGSLQNIESAEAAGDSFSTRPSLAVNGLGTILAALFGSCFPTTIYIGHPGWKGLGARAGYSTLNGVIIALICFSGTLSFIACIVPIEACIAIVLWIGIVITAQAFEATPCRHAAAVAIGLFPAIAAWGAEVMSGAFILSSIIAGDSANITMQAILDGTVLSGGIETTVNGFYIHAMNIMKQGYIFTSMILAAMTACLIDRKFCHAVIWSAIAAILSFVGLMHAYQIAGNSVDFLFWGMAPVKGATAYPAIGLGFGYLLMAAAFALLGKYCQEQAVED